MKLSDFDYQLPKELIAQHPADKRSNSRMLVLNRRDRSLTDCYFYQLPDLIDESYCIVVNDSKVFKARLFGKRESGGKVEIFLVRRLDGGHWKALLRPSARVKKGEKVLFDDSHFIVAEDEPGTIERVISFPSFESEAAVIETYGKIPLPPYIKRKADTDDAVRYQTVYASHDGSVAAPTAGLHFDDEVLSRLKNKGVDIERLTLHVGPGTFKPVTVDTIEEHTIDPEFAIVSEDTAGRVTMQKQAGKKLLAVGTTSIRTLEAVADESGRVSACSKMVDLFIYPPYTYKAVDAILTNFHLPKTSLLMLVAAFCDRDFLMEAYAHAVKNEYRFYSYGDCMLIL